MNDENVKEVRRWSNKTKVIFRVLDGEVVALFPELPDSATTWRTCDCYARIGQHAGADPWLVIGNSRPATPDEYAALKRELEDVPYEYNLDVVKRHTQNHVEARKAAWAAWYKAQ